MDPHALLMVMILPIVMQTLPLLPRSHEPYSKQLGILQRDRSKEGSAFCGYLKAFEL